MKNMFLIISTVIALCCLIACNARADTNMLISIPLGIYFTGVDMEELEYVKGNPDILGEPFTLSYDDEDVAVVKTNYGTLYGFRRDTYDPKIITVSYRNKDVTAIKTDCHDSKTTLKITNIFEAFFTDMTYDCTSTTMHFFGLDTKMLNDYISIGIIKYTKLYLIDFEYRYEAFIGIYTGSFME